MSKSVAGGVDVVLTADEVGYGKLTFTGVLTANINVIVPNVLTQWVVHNRTTGAFTLTVKTAAGNGWAVSQGRQRFLICNTVDVYSPEWDFLNTPLQGVPTATTAAQDTNTTQVATTAFVMGQAATQAEAEAGTSTTRWMSPLRVFQAIAKVVVQATEAALGIAKIATQTQTNAGTDDSTIVTPKKLRAGFAISLAANGYLTLPSWLGGLIIQWGAAPSAANATSAATFPLTFPNQCYQVIASGFNVNQVQAYAVVNSWNTVGFSWCGYNANAGSAPVLSQTVNGVQAQFIAIGR